MQVKHIEEKFAKLDEEHQTSVNENNKLRKQLERLSEDVATPHKNHETDQNVKQLRQQLNEKEIELSQCMSNNNTLQESNEFLAQKLAYSEAQVKVLNDKLLGLFEDVEKMKSTIGERNEMVDYLNKNNRELNDLVKEFQFNSRKHDNDSSSSYDMLNSTSTDLNNSSKYLLILIFSTQNFT